MLTSAINRSSLSSTVALAELKMLESCCTLQWQLQMLLGCLLHSAAGEAFGLLVFTCRVLALLVMMANIIKICVRIRELARILDISSRLKLRWAT